MQRIVLNILWAAFLAAAAAEGCFFALFDPDELLNLASPRDRMAAYTLGFLLFWLLGAVAATLAHLLNTPLWSQPGQAGKGSGNGVSRPDSSRSRPPGP